MKMFVLMIACLIGSLALALAGHGFVALGTLYVAMVCLVLLFVRGASIREHEERAYAHSTSQSR